MSTRDGKLRALIVQHEGATPAKVMGQALTDSLFRASSVAIAEARAARGLPTWLYAFEWLSASPMFGGKAFHCVDLPFAFDLLAAEGAETATGPGAPQKLADAMHGACVAFIRDLDPGAQWPRYTREHRDTMIWDTTPHTATDPLAAEREIWSTHRTPTA